MRGFFHVILRYLIVLTSMSYFLFLDLVRAQLLLNDSCVVTLG